MKKRPGIEAVDAYLEKVPEPQRTTLEKIRQAIRSSAPKEAEETICYSPPAFYYKGPLVAYGSFKDHCSLFPMAGGMNEAIAELSNYDTSKGTIRFPVDKPLPATIVKKIVKARVAFNEGKK